MQALRLIVDRLFLGTNWPLGAEFWKDEASPMRKILDDYTVPLVKEALEKREKCLVDQDAESEGNTRTALDGLLKRTQDPTVLNDEVIAPICRYQCTKSLIRIPSKLINLLGAGRDAVRTNSL